MSENLKIGGKGKRTWNRSNRKYYSPDQIYEILQRDVWPYKTNEEVYHKRDLALGSLLYLTSGRINEVLRLRKDQFVEDPVDQDFLVCGAFYVSKRRLGGIKKRKIKIGTDSKDIPIYQEIEKKVLPGEHPSPNIPMPRVGTLAPFTKIVEEYLATLKPTQQLFGFGKSRAGAIINCITKLPGENHGFFCHWFRAQSLTYQINLLRSTIIVAKDRGVENSETLKHYYAGEWREHAKELKK